LTRKSSEDAEAEYLNRPGAGTHGTGRPPSPRKKGKNLETDLDYADGPNAQSLKAAIAEAEKLEQELDTAVQEVAADDETRELLQRNPELAAYAAAERKQDTAPEAAKIAAIHETQIIAGQRPADPYAHIPEGEIAREQRALRGGQPFPKPGDLPIPGEPDCSQLVWNLGPPEQTERNELRARATTATQKLQWARAEIIKLRDKIAGTEQHTAAAVELRTEIIKALAELRPMAVRNA